MHIYFAMYLLISMCWKPFHTSTSNSNPTSQRVYSTYFKSFLSQWETCFLLSLRFFSSFISLPESNHFPIFFTSSSWGSPLPMWHSPSQALTPYAWLLSPSSHVNTLSAPVLWHPCPAVPLLGCPSYWVLTRCSGHWMFWSVYCFFRLWLP